MRDYVDARFNVGEFLLPVAGGHPGAQLPVLGAWQPITLAAHGRDVRATSSRSLLDGYMMWRGFKKVLAERLPKVSPKGLLMYGMNRMIQIRRFRMPAPRIKRGEAY